MHTKTKRNLLAVCGAACLSTHLQVSAQTQTTIDGYKISSPVNVLATRKDTETLSKEKQITVCIPAETTLEVLDSSDKDKYTFFVPKGSSFFVPKGPTSIPEPCQIPPGTANEKIKAGIAYTISKTEFTDSHFTARGITYGMLVIPFKYQLAGDKQFVGNASLGGYLGYRFDFMHKFLGVTATPIAFMGGSSISVKDANNTDTKNLAGFSAGLGLIGTLQGSFQAGVVLGWDWVGQNEGYQYNGKPWIAMQIGWAFLR
jgi:hypothetical protein